MFFVRGLLSVLGGFDEACRTSGRVAAMMAHDDEAGQLAFYLGSNFFLRHVGEMMWARSQDILTQRAS